MKKRPSHIRREEAALKKISDAAAVLGWKTLALPATAPEEKVPGIIIGTEAYVEAMLLRQQHVRMVFEKKSRGSTK